MDAALIAKIRAVHAASKGSDVAPNFYPAAIGVWRSVMPSWAVKPFVWTADPEKIIAAIDRERQVLDSIH